MPQEEAVPVGKAIRRRRRQIVMSDGKVMTQEDLGAASGIHASTISRIERGVHKPDIATLNAIAAPLGTTASALLAQGEPEPAGRAS